MAHLRCWAARCAHAGGQFDSCCQPAPSWRNRLARPARRGMPPRGTCRACARGRARPCKTCVFLYPCVNNTGIAGWHVDANQLRRGLVGGSLGSGASRGCAGFPRRSAAGLAARACGTPCTASRFPWEDVSCRSWMAREVVSQMKNPADLAARDSGSFQQQSVK